MQPLSDEDHRTRARALLAAYFADFSGEDAGDEAIVITDAPSMERFRCFVQDKWRAEHGFAEYMNVKKGIQD